MRNIKPSPRPVRKPLAGRTLNSTARPLTVWFNHAVLISSRNNEVPFQIRHLCNSETGEHIVVETMSKLREEMRAELIRVPVAFAYLFEVSR